MELLEYQKAERLTWRALAQRIGIKHPNLHAIATGRRDCSMETARRIEDATKGVVTIADISRVRRRWLTAHRSSDEPSEARP